MYLTQATDRRVNYSSTTVRQKISKTVKSEEQALEFMKSFSISEFVCTLMFNKEENPMLQPLAQRDQNQDPF